MWDLIVSVPDHCLSFYIVSEVRDDAHSEGIEKASFDGMHGFISDLKDWPFSFISLPFFPSLILKMSDNGDVRMEGQTEAIFATVAGSPRNKSPSKEDC